MRRTRLGRVVGSYRQPLGGWAYWPEQDAATGEQGFVVVAPSGARFEWVDSEDEAKKLADTRNREESNDA